MEVNHEKKHEKIEATSHAEHHGSWSVGTEPQWKAKIRDGLAEELEDLKQKNADALSEMKLKEQALQRQIEDFTGEINARENRINFRKRQEEEEEELAA